MYSITSTNYFFPFIALRVDFVRWGPNKFFPCGYPNILTTLIKWLLKLEQG
jgi:hypothetical protein